MDVNKKLDKTIDLYLQAVDVITGMQDLIAPDKLTEYTDRLLSFNDKQRRLREEIEYGTND